MEALRELVFVFPCDGALCNIPHAAQFGQAAGRMTDALMTYRIWWERAKVGSEHNCENNAEGPDDDIALVAAHGHLQHLANPPHFDPLRVSYPRWSGLDPVCRMCVASWRALKSEKKQLNLTQEEGRGPKLGSGSDAWGRQLAPWDLGEELPTLVRRC
jgi:hypothetical protein